MPLSKVTDDTFGRCVQPGGNQNDAMVLKNSTPAKRPASGAALAGNEGTSVYPEYQAE